MHPLLSRLPAVAIAGAVAGAALGAIAGWHDAAAGFPLLLLDSIRRGVHWTVVALVAFLILYEFLRWPIERRLPKSFHVPVAAALAAAPFFTTEALDTCLYNE